MRVITFDQNKKLADSSMMGSIRFENVHNFLAEQMFGESPTYIMAAGSAFNLPVVLGLKECPNCQS